jgi:hypothetical protein
MHLNSEKVTLILSPIAFRIEKATSCPISKYVITNVLQNYIVYVYMDYTLKYNGIPQMTPSLERILKHVAIER